MKNLSKCLLGLLMILALQSQLLAQSPFGQILGNVRDPSGSVMPGAKVTIINEDTKFERSMLTDGSGDYNFTDVAPGPHSLTIELAGFKKYQQTGVQLSQRQVLRLDAKMELGAVTETIEVKGEVSPVNSETATINENWEPKKLNNYFEATTQRSDAAETIANYSLQSVGVGSANYKINGARTHMARVVTDGRVAFHYFGLPLAQVGEIQMIAVNAPAEFSTPATISLTSKSGTNDFHGAVEYDLSHAALNSLGPNPRTRPKVQTGNYVAQYIASGPVVIPKFYNGRNRTFWTFSFERSKTNQTNEEHLRNVPTTRMRAGDFSRYANASGNLIPIIDPITGTPFAGNIIPAERISAVSRKIQALYPLPNRGPEDGTLQNRYDIAHQFSKSAQWAWRVDHKISDRDTVNFTYKLQDWAGSSDVGLGNTQKVVGVWSDATGNWIPSYDAAYTRVINPRMVNEFRWARDRIKGLGQVPKNGNDLLKQWGIQGIDSGLSYPGLPEIIVGGNNWFAGLGGGGNAPNYNITDEYKYTFLDNLTIQSGKHSIKTGFNYVRDSMLVVGLSGNPYGSYNFSGRFTRGSVAGAGNPWADFLLGTPETTSRFLPRPDTRPFNFVFGGYVQDDWKVTPRLTINLGVRYDLEGASRDREGLYFSFNPRTGAIVLPDEAAKSKVNPLFNKLIPLETAAQAGYAPRLVATDKNNFSPRVGIAFRPFNNAKSVVRVGYGMFIAGKMARLVNNSPQRGTLNTEGPFALNESFVSTQPGGGTVGQPTLSFPNPFLAVGAGQGASSYAIGYYKPDYRDPYMEQWNLTFEQEYWATAWRFSYVGSRATNLIWGRNINLPPPSTVPFNISSCGQPKAVPGPTGTCRRNYYGFTSINFIDQGGNDNYNSFQIEATHPFSNGLQIHGGWIWAKQINDAEDAGAVVGSNPYDRAYNRGDANFIPRHRMTIDFTYEAPFGRGKKFLSSAPAVVDQIVGRWVVSFYNQLISGVPYSIIATGVDPGGMGIFNGRADRIGSGTVSNPTRNNYFDPSAFAAPPCGAGSAPGQCLPIGRLGTSARNVLIGPPASNQAGRQTFLGIHKRFPLYKEGRVAFRLSAFMYNPFNNVYKNQPINDISNTQNVGKMTVRGVRAIQLGGRIEF